MSLASLFRKPRYKHSPRQQNGWHSERNQSFANHLATLRADIFRLEDDCETLARMQKRASAARHDEIGQRWYRKACELADAKKKLAAAQEAESRR